MVNQIVPDRLFTTLKYVKMESYSGSPLGANTYVGNSLYDPEYAVGGDQPVGFDEISALYERYRVNSSRIKVTWCPSSSSTVPVFCALSASGAITGASTPRLLTQNPYSVDRIVYGLNPVRCSLSMRMSTDKIIGEPKQKVQYDDIYSALVNANPLSLWYWNTSFAAADGSTNITGNVLVEITYDCEFYRRKYLGQS